MKTPSAAGKGDQDRTTDFKRYLNARIWWKSLCCGAPVKGDDPEKARCFRCSKVGSIIEK